MAKSGKIAMLFVLRMVGAIIGAIGFFLLAYQQSVLGTAFIGIGAFLIAVGES